MPMLIMVDLLKPLITYITIVFYWKNVMEKDKKSLFHLGLQKVY